MEKYLVSLFPMLFSLVCTAVLLHFLIPILKSRKMGQKILDIGPRWHKDKEGTPTMGGMSFVFSLLLTVIFCVFLVIMDFPIEIGSGIALTAAYAALSGLIGVTDDLSKLKNHRNEGLTPKEKFLLQLVLSALYVVFLRRSGIVTTSLALPFTYLRIETGVFFYVFVLLYLTGFSNAVNLTDGLDGLCAGVTAACMIFFISDGLRYRDAGQTAFSAVILGICLGFLIYNVHPAKVFMGDTGSLFLGAAVSGLALVTDNALILFIVGIVYVLEAASVILQVGFFKLTGKRLFLMAPLHHHFEKKGRSEAQITLFSVLLTVAVSVICFVFGK